MRKKLITAVIALTLVLTSLVGVTVAWLSVKTDPVTNTFSPSNIGLTLTETTTNYKMVPGLDIAKNPKVTVSNDIDCYVFVKVEEVNDVDTFLSYAIATGWKLYDSNSETIDTVTNNNYVIYREVEANAGVKEFSILANNKVTVRQTVTKTQMDTLYNADNSVNTAKQPKLIFTAYAIQKTGFATAAEAWAEAQKLG